MFIVQKNEASNKTIRMSNTLIEQLEEIAANEDISFNQLVVQCCEYALANLPKNDGKIACTIGRHIIHKRQDRLIIKYQCVIIRQFQRESECGIYDLHCQGRRIALSDCQEIPWSKCS